MANPFEVAPLGGLQTYANLGQVIGGGIRQYQADQQRQALQAEAQRLMQEGTPQEIASFSAANPELGQSMQQGIRFANEATEKNMKDSMQRIIAGENPEQVIRDRIQMVQSQGGDASDTARDLQLAQQDPNAYREMISRIYAMRYGEEGVPGLSGGPNIGQYNPRDYTTESFAEFVRTRDPSVLQRYASQQSVDIGGVPHVFDPAIGGYRPAGVAGTQGAQPVTAQTVAESEAAIAGERTRATEQARQDVEAGSPQERRQMAEAQQTAQQNIANFQGIVDQADLLLENDEYVEAMSGVSGKIPALPGTARYDAQVAFNQFKDTLTLGNLDKMSGVLTDRDIQVLASAAGGIEPGMSKEALVDRLNRIKRVFESKTASERKKLEEFMAGEAGDIEAVQPSIDDLINKYSD